MPLVVKDRDEMYGMVLWEFLLSMDGRDFHGWKADIYGWGNPPMACIIKTRYPITVQASDEHLVRPVWMCVQR